MGLVLGASLVLFGDYLRATGGVAPFELPGVRLGILGGLALCGAAMVALLFRRPLSALLAADVDDESSSPHRRHPYLTLFLASFVVLFIEVMLIRYCGAQLRVFAFYKNVPLVSAFLGLGLGACLGGGRSRHALAFLLWLLPLAVFLANGTILVDGYLGYFATAGSSEHILGDVGIASRSAGLALASQLIMGAFCVLTLVVITGLFALLGRLLGAAFEPVDRLAGYTVNIVGSLAGILVFLACSALEQPPWVWFLIGVSPLFWWVRDRRQALAVAFLAAASVVAVMPSYGDTIWSRYQKLVGHAIPAGPRGTGTASPAYFVQISDVFYQVAMDLRPEILAPLGYHPHPHYDGALREVPGPDRVLIVGAGTGNDAAAALRAGASRVDAVEIDPAIVEIGRRHHPEAPYADPRVRVVIDDARAAFGRQPPGTYDAVVFGLLDSHTQLGISSVRLDNYVFTLESFASARRLLRPGGHIVVTATSFRPWFRERLRRLLEPVCDGPLRVSTFGAWWTHTCRVDDPGAAVEIDARQRRDLPTDDWPFLYLPRRGVPTAYLIVVGMLAATSLLVLRLGGLQWGRFTAYHGHLFFLGAAFLLMEVYAINRLALLFGSTWLVSAVTIAIVLTLIVCANATVALVRVRPRVAYGLLFAALALSYWLEPGWVLGEGLAYSLAYGTFVLSPVYFAGLVFARSFRLATVAGPAIGANILGSVLGGWVEYATMLLGIRAMALLALAFYAGSAIMLFWSKGRGDAPTRTAPVAPPS